MTGKENLTSVTTGTPPSCHKFPSNKASSAQVTHNIQYAANGMSDIS